MAIIENNGSHFSNCSIAGGISNKEFILTVTIAAVLAVCFIFTGLISGDSIRYALGIKAIGENGFKMLPAVYHHEMSLGYYLIIIWLENILKFQGELSRLMNGLSAGASVLMISFLFLFVQSLYNRKLALFVCLAVLFSPTIWILSHHGNPNILAMAFFTWSLFWLDRILITSHQSYLQKIYWLFFILLVFVMVTVRTDMVLGFGAYVGLLYFRQAMSVPKLVKLIGALFLSFFLAMALRYIIFYYAFSVSLLNYHFFVFVYSPFVSLFNYHMTDKLPAARLPLNIMKNLALWAMVANIFVSILALLGLRRFGLKSRLVVLILTWVAPFLIFLPFQEIDISRVIVPTIPAISLLAMAYLYYNFESVKKNRSSCCRFWSWRNWLLEPSIIQLSPFIIDMPASKRQFRRNIRWDLFFWTIFACSTTYVPKRILPKGLSQKRRAMS